MYTSIHVMYIYLYTQLHTQYIVPIHKDFGIYTKGWSIYAYIYMCVYIYMHIHARIKAYTHHHG